MEIKNEIKIATIDVFNVKELIKKYEKRLCSTKLKDSNTPNLNAEIQSYVEVIEDLSSVLNSNNVQLSELQSQLSTLETQYIQQQNNFDNNFMSCSGLSQTLKTAEDNLTNYVPGTTSYERHRNFIASIKDKYYRCVRKSNVLITDYNTVFITQIYDTNEYEGNVNIIGDSDWSVIKGKRGPFYNTELIHNCEKDWIYWYNRS